MRTAAFIVGLLITLAGVGMLVSPATVLAFAQRAVTSVELYGSAISRLAIGALFIAVAPASRAPWLLRVLGTIALLAGVATLFLDVDRAQAIANWVSHQSLGAIRGFALVPLLLGGATIYACTPKGRAA
jgi:small-conductance mechanosensitive channel